MKKYVLGVILGIILLLGLKVNAANYAMKELIPVDIETTIVSNNFSYKDFYYNKTKDGGESDSKQNYVIFKGIKNLTKESLPISISIGLFDETRKNIGTINYCSKEDVLSSNEERSYAIAVDSEYLSEGRSADEVKYISVITDNINCHTGGSEDYVGETIGEIGQFKNTGLDSDSELFLKIVMVLVGIIFVSFLYSFLFTGSFRNMDGSDTRRGFVYKNRKLREKREEELIKNPPKVEEKKPDKPIEVLEEEEKEANSPKESSDLHNFYK